MTRDIKNKDFRDEWKEVKLEFENAQKKIKNYETRPLNDDDRKENYKKEILSEFNKITNFVAIQIEQFDRESQRQLLEKLGHLESILINRLQIIGFEVVEFPGDKLSILEEKYVKRISGDKSRENSTISDDSIFLDANVSLDFDDNLENLNESQNSDTKQSSKQSDEHENSIDENEKTVISAQNSNTIILNQQPNISQQTKMAPPAADVFLTMCTRHINRHFAGDPLERSAFIKSIKLLQTVAENDANKKILANYIHTRLTGKASECVPTDSEDIELIIRALEDNCRADNSKVIAGRLMALRADRANLTDFSKKAEQLCEAYQRSLVLEGSSREKAIELSIDKTIDLCKANTTSTVVKAMLASYKFEDANEVIAKYTIETRNVAADSQTLHFRANHRGRSNFNRNPRQNFHNNSRGNNYNNNNHNGWNGNSQIYRNSNYNNNNNGNRGRNFNQSRGQSRGNYHRNGQRNNVYQFNHSGNETAPPPGDNAVRMNRADNSN